MKKRTKQIAAVFSVLLLVGVLSVAAMNCIVCMPNIPRIITTQEASDLENIDCILVLGCQVKPDGTPSHMLEDRLRRSVALYEAGACQTLLMSGDHGQTEYNEVATMKQYAIDAGVPSQQIFMDHAGFSTYESIYRAKEIFGAKRIIIVTQEYHLYRALHIADALGLEAWGVDTAYRSYSGQFVREIREILARVKDLGISIFKPKPTYLGDPIDLHGSGDATNDK